MKFNLKKRRASGRDYSYHRSHKLGAALVPDFCVPSVILSQDAEDCTAFSAVGARQSETTRAYDPIRFWDDELKFAGVQTSDGFDLGVPAAVGVKTGFCPIDNPVIHEDSASAYYWIHSNNGQDLFDSVLSAVYQQNRPAIGGMDWYGEYTNARQGVIDRLGKNFLGGHAIRIAGKKTINDIEYAILPNTWGTSMGDNGVYYMSREVFNGIFSQYGVFLWSDSQDVKIKTLGFLASLYENVVALLQTLLLRVQK